MCGIVGYVGNEPAWPIILEGLQGLEYRGYDSAGVVVVDDEGQLQFRKTVGKVRGLGSPSAPYPLQGATGLGHTRWATHGRPSHANAHPQTDCHHRVAVVHNGIVENYLELKRQLLADGHTFSSDTDTEVITHLIEAGIDQGMNLEDAVLDMAHAIRGSQAITAMLHGPEAKICAVRLGHAGGIVVATRTARASWAATCRRSSPCCEGIPMGLTAAFLPASRWAFWTQGRWRWSRKKVLSIVIWKATP